MATLIYDPSSRKGNATNLALIALFWGALSAISLPLGALIGLWTRPSRKISSALMAFGGGALLFALTIELFGHVIHEAGDGHGNIVRPSLVLAALIAAILGGLLFNGLNLALEKRGGFLRRRALIRRFVLRKRRSEAKALLRSLSRVDYFRSLPAEEVYRLVPDIVSIEFAKGERIFGEGDEGDSVYVIAAGEVSIVRGAGEESSRVASLGPGDIFGEMALITDSPRNATVIAATGVVAWRLLKSDFNRHIDEAPKLKEAVQRVIEQRIQQLEDRGFVSEKVADTWSKKAIRRLDYHTTVAVTPDLVKHEQEKQSNPAMGIWLGIALDSIPESMVIGMLVVAAAAHGGSLSLAFIAGVFLANLPEALSSSVTMRNGGMKVPRILWMWSTLTVTTALGAALGAMIFPPDPAGLQLYVVFALEGFAGGAMLTMIAQTMLPEAFEHGGGPIVGLSTLGGFLVALLVKMLA